MKHYVRNQETIAARTQISNELNEFYFDSNPWEGCICLHCRPDLYLVVETIEYEKISSLFDDRKDLRVHTTDEHVLVETDTVSMTLCWDGVFLKVVHYRE